MPAPGPALAAIHLEQEVERRTRAQTEQIRSEARQAGFEEGASTARAEMKSVIEALRAAVDQTGRSTDDLLDELARSAVLAGVAIAEAVVGKVVVDDPEAMIDPVRRAIREVDGDDDLVLRLNPTDHTTLQLVLGGNHDNTAGDLPALIKSVRVIDDPSVPRGTCRAESAARIAIDGLEKRLDDIRRAVETLEGGAS